MPSVGSEGFKTEEASEAPDGVSQLLDVRKEGGCRGRAG